MANDNGYIGEPLPSPPMDGQPILPTFLDLYGWLGRNVPKPGANMTLENGCLSVRQDRSEFWGKLTWDDADEEWDFVELIPGAGALSTWSTLGTAQGGRAGVAVEGNAVDGPSNGYVLYARIRRIEYDVTGTYTEGFVFFYPFNGCIPAKS